MIILKNIVLAHFDWYLMKKIMDIDLMRLRAGLHDALGMSESFASPKSLKTHVEVRNHLTDVTFWIRNLKLHLIFQLEAGSG